MPNKRKIGEFFEQEAVRFLEISGLKLLEMNYRCRFGEIDLIAQDGMYLVFVEVKYRCRRETGYAAESVDLKKQRIISRVADFYLMSHFHRQDIPCRFDVVTFDGDEIHWYKNAFEYCWRKP